MIDEVMIRHAAARGQVRVRINDGYSALATLVAWGGTKRASRARVEYASGTRCTIRKDQVTEVLPLVVIDQ